MSKIWKLVAAALVVVIVVGSLGVYSWGQDENPVDPVEDNGGEDGSSDTTINPTSTTTTTEPPRPVSLDDCLTLVGEHYPLMDNVLLGGMGPSYPEDGDLIKECLLGRGAVDEIIDIQIGASIPDQAFLDDEVPLKELNELYEVVYPANEEARAELRALNEAVYNGTKFTCAEDVVLSTDEYFVLTWDETQGFYYRSAIVPDGGMYLCEVKFLVRGDTPIKDESPTKVYFEPRLGVFLVTGDLVKGDINGDVELMAPAPDEELAGAEDESADDVSTPPTTVDDSMEDRRVSPTTVDPDQEETAAPPTSVDQTQNSTPVSPTPSTPAPTIPADTNNNGGGDDGDNGDGGGGGTNPTNPGTNPQGPSGPGDGPGDDGGGTNPTTPKPTIKKVTACKPGSNGPSYNQFPEGEVPSGWYTDLSKCQPKPPSTTTTQPQTTLPPAVDVCPNIPGNQGSWPSNRIIDGQCKQLEGDNADL